MQRRFFYTAIDIADRVFVAGDDVKISPQFYATIPNGPGNVLEIIDCKFLRYHIDDLVTGRNISFVLISHQLIYFRLRDFFLCILSHDVAAGLQTFDVVPSNSNIHFIHFQVGVRSIAVFQRSFDGFDRFIDIQYLSMLHTVAVGAAKSKNFQFAEFIFSSGDHRDLGCSNVEADNNGLFVVHSMMFLVVALRVTGYELRVTSYGLWVTGYGLWV